MPGSAFALLLCAQVNLPGTQPNELVNPPEPSSSCNCHLNFASDTFTEPGQTYKATPMALSGRDPLFRAALKVAYRDRPDAADLCIRCHAPVGWLKGRSTPGDGSLLEPEDLESVTCDMCHRQIPSVEQPQLIGSGQYTLHQDTSKRARRGNAPENGHTVVRSDFIGSSEMCGTCHSLFNPLEIAHDALGNELGHYYYEQRTYEEWKDSAFPARNEGCVFCHLKPVRGRAARQGLEEYNDLASHMIVGGNDFIARALVNDPFVDVTEELPFLIQAVEESLRSAVKLEIISTSTLTALEVFGEDEVPLGVRLTNRTGHKLPSGYPEGRRVYLEVLLSYAGTSTTVSGEWDPATGNLKRDPQIRTYETEHGRVENGVSMRIRDLIKMNQIISDTRIPPEGFRPSAPDMAPAGRDYGSSAPYRHFDEHTYSISMPRVTATTTGTITVRARYMITDGDVVDFLVEAAGPTSEEGRNLRSAFDRLNKLPPRVMAEVSLPILIHVRPVTDNDAGVPMTPDSGEDVYINPIDGGGCACRSSSTDAPEIFALLVLALLIRKRRS